ncbi:hypothetical protein Q75_05830 [Bacillus coahuilensis p1.1.43]|uniref:HTH marR-type domain-containing protein n=2 Tax=Bacillus coahuilensis TaxID=408580 RepID=A0A147K9C4_9BACI|nr:MarR family transcriptional regulator [Bacillus coahuilensis]KUP07048.1 hypothetical protein Q75_05830 [Bacillus coahuilensis p1.1.43]
MQNYNLNDSICFVINLAGKNMVNSIATSFKQAGYDITYEQWTVLTQLWNQDGRTQNEIASMTSRDQTCTSRLIDNLEKHNYLTRQPSAADRRIKEIYLTANGKELQEKLSEIAQQTIDRATVGISPAEMALCKDVLKRVACNLG